ncbi:MAG: hypothetical protein ACHQF2_10870 [Flavobacteriales bacterium]
MESEDLDLNTILDKLSQYYDHPLNLNRASREELQELYLLNDIQINELLRHIERFGRLISIYELQSLDTWNNSTIQNILPFVYVPNKLDDPHTSIKDALKNGQNDLFLRWGKVLELQDGYRPVHDSIREQSPNSHYLGSRDKLYARYRFTSGNFISAGVTAEKDAGEEFFRGSQQSSGFDFYSGHVFIRKMGPIKQLALGDYQVAFGQGLTLSSGLAFGKTGNTLAIKRFPYGFKPYTSVDENAFMRGAAVTLEFGKLNFSAMYSQKDVDANITADSSAVDDDVIASSFQTSGIHATPNALEDKDAINQKTFGGNIAYSTRRFHVAGTFAATELNASLQEANSYYNLYDFRGNKNYVAGLDYSWIHKNMNIFGESARSMNGGWAHLHGAILTLDQRIAISALYRNYSPEFQPVLANSFAEGSLPINEQGMYVGVEINASKTWLLNFYADGFKSKWLRYQLNAPSEGYEFMAQATWKPNKKVQIYVRGRYRQKEINTDVTVDDIEYSVPLEQTNFRIHGSFKVSESITLRNRGEWINYHKHEEPAENGYMLYQDVIYKPMLSPFSFSLRYAIFSTDSYNSRIYAYENDVLYYYSVPAYYYRGSRVYATLRYQFRKSIDVWFRIGQWLYTNKYVINSGTDEILGNRKTEMRLQIRLSF